MKRALGIAYALVLAVMVVLTIRASVGEDVLHAFARATRDPWFLATLGDAYFAFAAIGAWAAWLERGARGAAWCAAILLLGNAGIAAFVIVRLVALAPGEGLTELLARRRAA